MAGLTAARYLAQQGWDVTVLDKGRGVGGRLATRRIDQARADHGAQYFSAQSHDFKQFVDGLMAKGLITKWQPVVDTGRTDELHTQSYYIGADGMSAIAKEMARGLTVCTNEKVVKIQVDATQWHVETEAGTSYRADTLICTVPAPQALELWQQSNLALDLTDQAALSSIVYEPCLAVMVTMNQPSKIPAPGAIAYATGDLNWVVDNQQKGISTEPSATIHASAAFSQKHYNDDLQGVAKLLVDQLTKWIPADTITAMQIHRWRYSVANNRYPKPFLAAQATLPLLFGDDGFGDDNYSGRQQSVERAFISGRKMAAFLLR